MRDKTDVFAVIAGGGTGGHVYPAIAIADALVYQGLERHQIHFVGSKRALEVRVVPEAGYGISLLSGRGIKRSLSLDNVLAVGGLIAALIRAIALLAKMRPKVVVSVGGYAAAPAAFAAIALRIPLVIAESNAVPGAVHRIAGGFAKAAAISWPGTPLRHAVLTGNPVRADLANLVETPHERVTISVFGGSLGSQKINQAVKELAELWSDRRDVAIYHVVGKRDWANTQLRAHLDDDAALSYGAVAYEDDMAGLYAAADIVIARAGATTCAELAIVGMPSILVPFPQATGDHQAANARALADHGAAVVVPDHQCTGARLAEVLGPLVTSPQRLIEMGKAAKELANPDAAANVAQLVIDAARGRLAQ